MIQNQDFINEFVDEAKTHIEKVEAALLHKGEKGQELINDVFRAVHSIKGTAGFFGLKNIVSLAHAMENVFAEIRSGKKALSDDVTDVMIECNDCLRDMIFNVLQSEDYDTSLQLGKLQNVFSQKEEKDNTPKESITVTTKSKIKMELSGANKELVNDGLRHGHKVYELKLRMNKDLLNYAEGPVKLFKKIQSVGTLVDTMVDHSEINSLDDIIDAVDKNGKDVYLGVIATTVLEKELFSKALEISTENINELNIEIPKEQPDDAPEVSAEQPASLTADTAPKKTGSAPDTTKQPKSEDNIRVHVSVLNDLLNMASEMVLGRNQLLRTLEEYKKGIPGLSPILQNIDRLTSGMQEKIMQTRMQPMSNVFGKFPRIIRDLAKNLSKEIELQLEGEDVELDKSVIEALTDPLTHLVRNSADHGLEKPEERVKMGKPSIGLIKLRAFHEGGYVNIDVIDDGAGIDSAKLIKKALEKDIVTKEEVSRMSEQEALKLIFRPGFSTAEKISDVSGRGVGMDVVRTNIEKLGGSIEIFTVKNSGTTIRLMLPLTLAIIQSLIVEVEGQKFALPQVNLKEIVRIKQGDKSRRIENIHDSEVLRLRGKLLPIIHLADVLGIQRTYIDPVTGERKPEKRKSFTDTRASSDQGSDQGSKRTVGGITIKILVLQVGARFFGLAVDSIFTSEETLVKPLPVYLKSCDCYSGVTIMGDGKTAMILDVEGLIRISGLKFKESDESIEKEALYDEVERQNILLFKCSGNETYAIDLSMVSRVEEIKNSDIDRIGNKEFIKFRGDSLRVIRPEDHLPVNNGEILSDKKYILIPKLVKHPIGIIAEKIIDNINTTLVLNTKENKVKGLLGTAIYDNKIILLINIYELFELADPIHYNSNSMNEIKHGKLLLVEDTPFFQRQEKEYLSNAGFDVIAAGNGKEALEILNTTQVDIVVSDIQMPVMDGFELAKKIRENKKYSSLPLIAVTSMSGEKTKEQVFSSGFDYYEFKLDRDRLINTVLTALGKGGVSSDKGSKLQTG